MALSTGKHRAQRELAALKSFQESEGWGMLAEILGREREHAASLLTGCDPRDAVRIAQLQAKHGITESFLLLPATLAAEREDILARPDDDAEDEEEDSEDDDEL